MEKQHPTKTKQNKKGVFNNMTKKRNSIARLILCAVLTATMMLSMALSVMAEGGDDATGLPSPYSKGTSANDPATAGFTKIFKIPINTTTPAATFTFTITPVGIYDPSTKTYGTVTTGMPNLGPVTVSFVAGQSQTFIDNGTKYLVDQTGDILAGLAKDGSAWAAGAGIYKYTVKETQSGITFTEVTTDKEFEVYSGAVYDIEIWVEEDANGVLFPMYIVGYFNLTEGTQDEYYPGTPGDEDKKLDPTPGETVPGTPGEIGKNYSDIIFTNRYWKTDGPTNPDPEKNALEIKKVVTGNNPDTDKYFTFNVNVTTPDIVGSNKTYRAYIVGKDGTYVDLDAFLDADGAHINLKSGTSSTTADDPAPNADYITFTSGTPQTVKLKDGERLVFFDLEVGAIVEAEENIEPNVRVTYQNTFDPNLAANTAHQMPVGTTGTWGFPRDPGDAGLHYTKEGAKANISTFINNMTGVPPTGITIDNLPYVIIIGLAVAGLVGFFVIKFRKNAKENIQ